MACVKWIDWNPFSEALGHLKFYICRLGGGLAWRRTGEKVGGWASERAVGGRADGWASGRAGERAVGRRSGWARGGAGGWARGYHMACC